MKISHRLTSLADMINRPYVHIWDCCCDHGFLGAELLNRQLGQHIHFVDIVEPLMAQLTQKLQQFYPLASQQTGTWSVHCIDVATLPIAQFADTKIANKNHSPECLSTNNIGAEYTGSGYIDAENADIEQLIIIAGVGGDLMQEMVEAIIKSNPNVAVDFLLCPVHHQFRLRQMLAQQGFVYLDEKLIKDNQRYYEILKVRYFPKARLNCAVSTKVSPVGDKIWQAKSTEQAEIVQGYLHKTLTHYQKRAKQAVIDTEVGSAITAYSAVAKSLFFSD